MREIQKHKYFLKEYNKKMEEVIQREEGKDGMSIIQKAKILAIPPSYNRASSKSGQQ